jgi:hypothetical protein
LDSKGEEKEAVGAVEAEAVVEVVEMVLTAAKIEIINQMLIQARWQKMMPKLKKAR